MKLKRLAGYGPLAAFVTAGSLLVYASIDRFGSAVAQAAPGLLVPMEDVYFLAVSLWTIALAVVVFDLEWIQHPTTSTRWLQLARVATLVALVMPLVIDIAIMVKAGVAVQAPSYLLLYSGVGLSLVVHNLEGRRAGIVAGVLPLVGAAAGAAYAIAGVGFGMILIPGIGMTAWMVGFNVLTLGQVLYVVWAVGMGVHLSRSKVTAPAMAAASAAQ
jgi:hypothetical protein